MVERARHPNSPHSCSYTRKARAGELGKRGRERRAGGSPGQKLLKAGAAPQGVRAAQDHLLTQTPRERREMMTPAASCVYRAATQSVFLCMQTASKLCISLEYNYFFSHFCKKPKKSSQAGFWLFSASNSNPQTYSVTFRRISIYSLY